MSELLSPTEIRDLAGCVARERQREKLATLGIPFKADGKRTLVSREHVRQWLSGMELRSPVGPRLDLVK